MNRLAIARAAPIAPFGVPPTQPRPQGGAVLGYRTSGLPQRTSGTRDLSIRAADEGRGSAFSATDLRTESGSATKPAAAGTWRLPSVGELQAELVREPVFARAFQREGETESSRWLGELATAIEKKVGKAGETLPPGHDGCVMILRFPAAYRSVGHMAIATAWRNDAGRLKLRFLHQESLPDVAPDGTRKSTFSGDFFGTFDTRRRHADGLSPVEESIKLAGLPNVNVAPCREPQSLPQITRGFQKAVGTHVYGMSATWPGVAEGRSDGRTRFANCFMVSHLANEALSGRALVFPEDHDTSGSIRALEPMICMDLGRWGVVGSGDKARTIEEIFRSGSATLQIKTAEGLGVAWGQDRAWDVAVPRRVESKAVVVGAGTLVLPELAPGWHAIKFSAEPKGLSFVGASGGAGEPVKAGVTYSRHECAAMQLAGATKLRFDVSYPIGR